LEQLLKYDFPVHIQTKSDLIKRDIDIISKFSDIEVMMSIGTLNDSERKILEPGSSPIIKRLDILKSFSDIGIKSTVFFGPIYPTIPIEDVSDIINTFIENGASEIVIDKLNLKPGVWENIKAKIIDNNDIYNVFLKNIIKEKDYYQNVREKILKNRKNRKIKIIDAF